MLAKLKSMAKSVLERNRRRQNAKLLEQTERHFTRTELAQHLRSLGVVTGDTLFVHSSLKSLGYVEGGATAVLGALQDAVGPGGTLMLPTYYMPGGTILGTCLSRDYVFDAKKFGTNMGRLPEAFLAGDGISRSIHPTHSVSAWGRHAAFLTDAHHRAPSVFGLGSPWQRVLEVEGAKVLGLGISMGPVTFYHVLEDSMADAFPVPVWLAETYHLPCIDAAGKTWQVPVRPFDATVSDRRIDHGPRNDLREYFRVEFENAGLKVNGRVGSADSWFIPARAFFEHLRSLANEGITIYSTADQLLARPLK
jgi:aminoglycoside 3-N-acetyltransferase